MLKINKNRGVIHQLSSPHLPLQLEFGQTIIYKERQALSTNEGIFQHKKLPCSYTYSVCLHDRK